MTDTNSEPTELVDLQTGSMFLRWPVGESVMTAEIVQHPYRRLKGKAFVTLRPMPVFTDDDLWVRVVGLNVTIPGGVEVDVDGERLDKALEDIEECDHDWKDAAQRRPDLIAIDGGIDLMIPVIVNDIDLPPMRALIPVKRIDEGTQQIQVGAGVNARGSDTAQESEHTCGHKTERDGYVSGCRSCLRRYWTGRAIKEGVING